MMRQKVDEPALDVQYACDAAKAPEERDIAAWVGAALRETEASAACSLTVRLVGLEEGTTLNQQWRGRSGPTNVLSFPFEAPAGLSAADTGNLLGDIIICAPVAAREAEEQNKTLDAHWAHLVIHGTLHLLGYDHLEDIQAERMEALESKIMARLGYPDPYSAEYAAECYVS